MSQFFESQNVTDPIDNLPIGFATDINQRIESYYKCKEMQSEWIKIVESKHNSDINQFFDKNESSLLCSGSWYLKELIITNNIDSLNYILNKTKSFHINSPFTYCICNKYRNFTPMQLACSQSNFDIIKLLLNKGANVSSQSNHRIINLLFQYNQCMDKLNLIPCIHHLVSCGAKVPKDSIYYLARYCKLAINDNNNDNNQQMDNRHCHNTPKSESYFDIVSLAQYLALHKADINYIATALDRGYYDLAQFMIDNGAHLDDNILRYIVHKSSFIWLFANNYIKDINHNNKYNGTALFYHTEKHHYTAVETLISYNADLNIRCKHSKLTAIQVAMFNDYEDIVKLLYNPSSYQTTPALLKDIQSAKFQQLPTNPHQLKKILIDYHNDKEQDESKVCFIFTISHSFKLYFQF